jgi:hypothetical protein
MEEDDGMCAGIEGGTDGMYALSFTDVNRRSDDPLYGSDDDSSSSVATE